MMRNLGLDKVSTSKPGTTMYEILNSNGQVEYINMEKLVNPSLNYKEKIYYYPNFITNSRGKSTLDTSTNNVAKVFHTAGQSDFPYPWDKKKGGAAVWDYPRNGTYVIYYFDERPNLMYREYENDENERDCFYKKRIVYEEKTNRPLSETIVTSFGFIEKGFCTDFIMQETIYKYGGAGGRDKITKKYFRGVGNNSTEISENEYNDIKNNTTRVQSQYEEPKYEEPRIEQEPKYEEPRVIKPKPVNQIPEVSTEEVQNFELEPQVDGRGCYFIVNNLKKGSENLIPIDANKALSEQEFKRKLKLPIFNTARFVVVYSLRKDLGIDNDGMIAVISPNIDDVITGFNIQNYKELEENVRNCTG
jgi:hypothetical protein